MSDIKLFKISGTNAIELQGGAAKIEKELQTQMEANLETYLGVRFLDTEYYTGTVHNGYMDTIGIDENGSPVIIEYKRHTNENVINQGLFYLDWLMDHQADFELLVINKFGKKVAETIDWTNPRLLCIAGDFTKYDEHAVKQMNRNIELIRYKKFDKDLLLLELVNVVEAKSTVSSSGSGKQIYKTVSDHLKSANDELTDLYLELKDYMLSLGDDVQEKTLKYYFAYKRIKNFACVEIYTQSNKLLLNVKVSPDEIQLEKGFTRDVRNIGHLGTGDLEITIKDKADLEKAEPLILRSYEAS